MKFVPKKVFILQNGVYKEITYQELSENEKYNGKYFLPLYGMLMEVNKDDYLNFYKDRNHQRYLYRTEINREVLYYDTWTTDECNGEELLIDEKVNIEDEVEKSILKQKIHEFSQTDSRKQQ